MARRKDVAAFDHDMPAPEIEALIRSLGLQADVLHLKILQLYGSIQDAVMHKRNGDALAANLLRERSKLLNEKRRWQKSLDALPPKGYF